MQYKMMISPFEKIDFDKMNKKQAAEFYEWYINQINERITILQETVKEDRFTVILDYSVESLIPLWEWYENKITYRKIESSELESRNNRYPEWMKDFIPDTELSWETLMYCMDIAIYFAEVIIKHNSTIHWGCFTKPRNRTKVNQPVLLGFKHDMDLNPRLIVENCTRRSGKEKKKTRVYDMYFTWLEYI